MSSGSTSTKIGEVRDQFLDARRNFTVTTTPTLRPSKISSSPISSPCRARVAQPVTRLACYQVWCAIPFKSLESPLNPSGL
jgi:hypothetical protein